MKAKSLSSIQKTCRILSSLVDPNVTRLTDIARVSDLDMSTCLRILKDLEIENFVERDPESKHYTLGTQVYVMHQAMVKGLCPITLAKPSLIRLAKNHLDTVILSTQMGWESICLDICFGDYPIRANYLQVGSHRPLGVGAGSLALLASVSESERHEILPFIVKSLDRYPDFSYAYLLEKVEETKANGYAVLLDVVVERMGGISMAIKGPDGSPLAAISIAALSERITQRELELAASLKEEVQRIEQSWMP